MIAPPSPDGGAFVMRRSNNFALAFGAEVSAQKAVAAGEKAAQRLLNTR